jgi:nitroreductase
MATPSIDADTWADFVRSRRSIRDFRADPIPDHLLRSVIDDALASPSWSNTQPFRLALATGDLRDRISSELCARYDEATRARRGGLAARLGYAVRHQGRPTGDFDVPLVYPADLQERRRATGYGLYSVLGIDRSDPAARDAQMRRNFEFFGAPAVVFVFVHEGLGEYSVLDAGVMLQTLMLSAHVRGLGTCAQGALALWSAPVRDAFVVPEPYRLLCGVSIGFPSVAAVNAYSPERLGVEAMLLPGRP